MRGAGLDLLMVCGFSFDPPLRRDSTVSRPFPTPETDKIAIKVINHYGDEVLQVYEI